MQLPTDVSQRRLFYCVLLYSILTIALVRLLVVGPLTAQPASAWDIVEKLLGDLFSSLMVTVILGFVLVWLFPKEIDAQEVPRKHATEYFEKAYDKVNFWEFSGASGSFTRAKTLPTLHEIASRQRRTIQIRILVMDVRDSTQLAAYASYKSAVDDSSYGGSDARNDVLSTLVAAALYSIWNPYLDISIHLKKSLGRYRYDVCDLYAIVTRESPQESALLVNGLTQRYFGIREEIQCQRDQGMAIRCRPLQPSIPIPRVFDQLEWIHVAEILNLLGFVLLIPPNPADQDKLLGIIKRPKQRYAS